MKTIILAAGLGTRVQNIYPYIPKVMIPLNGRPLLLHTIERLKLQGFNDFLINLHYYPDVITDYFADGKKFGVSIQYSYEEELLEVAGAIKKMEPIIDSDTFMLIYGDMYFTRNMKKMVEFHQKNNAFGTMSAKKTMHVEQSDILEIDLESYRVTNIYTRPHNLVEQSESLFANVGLHVWSREVLQYIEKNKKISLDREIVPVLYRKGKELFALPIGEEETILDMGKPDNIKALQANLNNNK